MKDSENIYEDKRILQCIRNTLIGVDNIKGIQISKIINVFPLKITTIHNSKEKYVLVFNMENNESLHLQFLEQNIDDNIWEAFFSFLGIFNKLDAEIDLFSILVFKNGDKNYINKVLRGQIKYNFDSIFIKEFNGNLKVTELEEKIDAGKSLSSDDKIDLLFLPLMQSINNEDFMIDKTIELIKKINNLSHKINLLGSFLGIANMYSGMELIKKYIVDFDDMYMEEI